MNIRRNIQHITQELTEGLKSLIVPDTAMPSKEEVKARITGILEHQYKAGILAAKDSFRVGDVTILWETWTDDQKSQWQIVNEVHPEIAKDMRGFTDMWNLDHWNPETEMVENHKDYPWWAIPDPTTIIVTNLFIQPVKSIDFININLSVSPKELDEL